MKSPRIYHLHIDTPSFTFDAYGATSTDATEAMQKALRKHIKETGADPEYFGLDDLSPPTKVVIGRAYRDGFPQ